MASRSRKNVKFGTCKIEATLSLHSGQEVLSSGSRNQAPSCTYATVVVKVVVVVLEISHDIQQRAVGHCHCNP